MELATLDILDRLVAFASVSSRSNRDIAGWIEAYLRDLGFDVRPVPSPDDQKVGLFARIGPSGDGGLLLSGHMDVVPVEGQDWTREPFRLTRADGRLYGRGTTDMKGFLAAALSAARTAAGAKLARPFQLSLSYDEELGCLGIRQMIGHLPAALGQPALCIVGEPTGMAVATGHKGKIALRADCRGQAGHSAMAPHYMNALHLATDLVGLVRAEQAHLVAQGARDEAYDIPFSTLHVGKLSGGLALNIVPDRALVDFELRHLAADDPGPILGRLRAGAADCVARAAHPAAAMRIEVVNEYPGLDASSQALAVQAAQAALPSGTPLIKVAYGTEAGFFAAQGISTVVCGPGDMAQGHQPDEYLEEAQLQACEAMLGRLVAGLSA
ncbi:MAG TPA: acetylornithine deacetylase [Paracoccaceae bacterium]|nr:acetylornithine deacetylase [Paracoccaceae bacterium]